MNLNNSGTTVACVILRGGLMFVANVGDSVVVLGKVNSMKGVIAEVVTTLHKPNVAKEKDRIRKCDVEGVEVKLIDQVERVVYNDFPKLNITRSLGDLWSHVGKGEYIISPNPDVVVRCIDPTELKYILLLTDGVSDVMDPQSCIELVHDMSGKHFSPYEIGNEILKVAQEEWKKKKLSADNMSAVTILVAGESQPPNPYITLK